MERMVALVHAENPARMDSQVRPVNPGKVVTRVKPVILAVKVNLAQKDRLAILERRDPKAR